MGTAGSTRERSIYGLLVGLGARAVGVERRVLAPEIARAVAAPSGPSCSPPWGGRRLGRGRGGSRGALARLPALARARVETLDARLVSLAVSRNGPASALDLDKDLAAEGYLKESLGCSDAFAVPLRVAGGPAGALVVYLGLGSLPPDESDLLALAGLGDVLALAAGPAASHAPAVPEPAPRAGGLLRRLFSR
jgi:hypothetical protein